MYTDQEKGPVSSRLMEKTTTPKLIEASFGEQQDQLAFMTETMRRIEDLADRVAGAVPTGENTSADRRDYGPGLIGGLRTVNADRQMALTRMAEALSRIENII